MKKTIRNAALISLLLAMTILFTGCKPEKPDGPVNTPPPSSSEQVKPQETPQPTAKPTPSPEPTAKPTPSPKPTAKPTPSPEPTPQPTPTPAVVAAQLEIFENGSWVAAKDKTATFLAEDNNECIWQPGAAGALTPLRIVNTGNTDIDFTVAFNGLSQDTALAQAISWNILSGDDTLPPDKLTGTVKAGQTTEVFTVAGTMAANAENSLQSAVMGDISVSFTAQAASQTVAETVKVQDIVAADYTVTAAEGDTVITGDYLCNAEGTVYTFTLTAAGSASTGYDIITINGSQYLTQQIESGRSIEVKVNALKGTEISFASSWGTPAADESLLVKDGDTIVVNPFAGKKISTLGDSISTYTGWSDANPITGPECRFRYGEAYYGPVGGDFHNTELVVEDTWWHQAATQLGAEILISNAGNSTGVLYASYPANLDWQQYLQEMLSYKTRPYYLGTETEKPDIIALYIGSSDVARYKDGELGDIKDINFDTLIVANGDGSFTYAEPVTVAEAYAIMMHKISVTYPDAEIYCFEVVPNSGGYLSTVNGRLVKTHPFNAMVRGVAEHYGAITVDLLAAFGLDPDCDGTATQQDFEYFQSCFNGDPHPNAAGFDVITKAFVTQVLANSKYR